MLEQHRALLSPTRAPRLGRTDRARLDAYFDRLRDLQESLTIGAGAVCGVPAFAAPPDARMEDGYRAHVDLAVAAMQCDLTRIVVFTISHCASDPSFDHTDRWHQNSHDFERPRAVEESLTYNQWVARRVHELLEAMDATVDVDGRTLLDNSVVLWGNEIGYGEGHHMNGMPVLLAGSAGGRLLTGRYVDYRQRPFSTLHPGQLAEKPIGRSYNQHLCSLFRALGVEEAAYQREGVRGFGDSAGADGRYDRFIAAPNSVLPSLLA